MQLLHCQNEFSSIVIQIFLGEKKEGAGLFIFKERRGLFVVKKLKRKRVVRH